MVDGRHHRCVNHTFEAACLRKGLFREKGGWIAPELQISGFDALDGAGNT